MRDRLRHFRDRFPLAAIGIEIFSIVLAVLLALAVDQWREERGNRQLAEAALASMRYEIQANQRLLKDRYPYHSSVRDSLRRIASSLTEGLAPDAMVLLGPSVFPRGGRFFDLSAAAYRTAQSSGALTHVDFDVLSILMAIYDEQESLESSDASFGDVIFSPQNLQRSALFYTANLAAGLINDVLDSERELLTLYDQFLEMTTSLGTAAPLRTDSPSQPDTLDRVQP